jgi:hypothetical protein
MLTDSVYVKHEATPGNPMASCSVPSAVTTYLTKSGSQLFTQKGRYGSVRNEIGGLQRKLQITFDPMKNGLLRKAVSLTLNHENPSVEGQYAPRIITLSEVGEENPAFVTPTLIIAGLTELLAFLMMGQPDSASDFTGTLAHRIFVGREY